MRCLAAWLPAPHCRVLMNDNGCRGARYLRRRTGCERSCCWRRSGGVAQRASGEGGRRPPPPPQRGAAASVPTGPSPLLFNGIRTCAARGGLLQAQQGTAELLLLLLGRWPAQGEKNSQPQRE